MKLLFDQNISFRITKKLNSIFPDCKHVSDCGLMNCDDNEIWKYALAHAFSIVTFDADFYDISVMLGHPPKIIWVRIGNMTTNELVKLLIDHQEVITSFIKSEASLEMACLELQ
jgi:predicted nuclease of predicted toxin-antitoxin system